MPFGKKFSRVVVGAMEHIRAKTDLMFTCDMTK